MILAQLPGYKIVLTRPNSSYFCFAELIDNDLFGSGFFTEFAPTHTIYISLDEIYEADGKTYRLGYYEKEKTFFLSEIIK